MHNISWTTAQPLISQEGLIPWNQLRNIHSFIRLVVCLTTSPKPLPKRALHLLRSRASFFKLRSQGYWNSQAPPPRRSVDTVGGVTKYIDVICKWSNLSQHHITGLARVCLTLILRRSRTGTVWFYTSTSSKRAGRPKLYTKSLTRDLKRMYSRLTLVRISINL